MDSELSLNVALKKQLSFPGGGRELFQFQGASLDIALVMTVPRLKVMNGERNKMFEQQPVMRVPYTFYVKCDGAIYFLVNRDLEFFLNSDS